MADEPLARITFFALTWLGCAAGRGNFDGMHAVLCRAGEPAGARNDGDLVLLHQEFEALDVLGDDGVFALEHRGPVERGRADAGNAKLGGVLQVVP